MIKIDFSRVKFKYLKPIYTEVNSGIIITVQISHKGEVMRILIVDDDFLSRRILTKLLAPYGVCEVAVNGVEAIGAFTLAQAENSSYQLICLDIMMPEMDGQEVLKIIRTKEKEAGIPQIKEVKIIMTSALDKPKDVFAAYYHGGCTSYLRKPIERENLYKILDEFGIVQLDN
jgi:two-component system chemotaxis response regulator CheY